MASERRSSGKLVRWKLKAARAGAVLALLAASGCGGTLRRFPLRDPMARDTDLAPVKLPCHEEPTPKDPKHVSCAPEVYVSPLAWDAADNTIFRALSRVFAIDPADDAPNVNSLDEVPDSAWFENRIGMRPIDIPELTRGACSEQQMLTGETVADGAWLIDQGKMNGASPGFRVKLPDKGKYMLKTDGPQLERPTAAAVIGAAAYYAAGFNTSCEQVILIKPSSFTLTPGLTVTDNSGITRPFDAKALQKVLDEANHRGEYRRLQASAWLPGYLLGPFRYEKTRDDDPHDIIPHEDRRELRGARLLAAWLNHFDAREQNSMDSWIGPAKSKKPELGPGFIRHYYLDTSDCLGSEWDWDGISRRLGHAHLLDWGYLAGDFATLGIIQRPWDTVRRHPGMELFGYFDVDHFDPEGWVNEYPNPAFSRMTERDGAWMARILARFTPERVRALAEMGRFEDPARATYLASVLEGRLEKILKRYLTRLSPLADVRVEGTARLCATDLARSRGIGSSAAYRAELVLADGAAKSLPVTVPGGGARVCVDLPALAGARADKGTPGNYLVVRIFSSAEGPLEAHLYDLGPRTGYRLAGIERPSP